MTTRHDRLVKILAHAFRAAGADVHVEYRPMDDDRRRPDLSVTFPEESILADVVVSHPAARSRISVAALATSRRAEKAKVARYKDIARAEGARVLAFAVESYGAFGEHATEIIRLIRRALRHSDLHEDRSLHDLLPQHLAIALQKGNCLVARIGSLRARRRPRCDGDRRRPIYYWRWQ